MNILNSNICALIALPAAIMLTSSCSQNEAEIDPPYDLSVAYHPLASDATNLTPAAGDDVTALPTFTWNTGADDDRYIIRIREYVTGTYQSQDINLTRAQANCVEPDRACSYTVGTLSTDTPLVSGLNIWYIKSYDDDDNTESGWARDGLFTVNGTARPVAVSPVSVNTAINPPSLVFEPVGGSTFYIIRLADSDSSIYDNPGDLPFVEFTPSELGCDDGVTNCTLPATLLRDQLISNGGTGTLAFGQVRWAVKASNNNWTNPTPIFTIAEPCADDPLGTSCDDSNICTTDVCNTSVNPAGVCESTDDDTQVCDDGNACTTGDICNDGQCRATDQAACRVSTVLNPSAVTGANENFQWNSVRDTENYRIYVRDALTKEPILREVVTAAGLGCVANALGGDLCTYDPANTLPNGEFEWFVQTPPLTDGCCTETIGNSGFQDTWHGPWSSAVRFQVGYERPVTISPVNDVSTGDTTPAVQWNPVSGSNHTYVVRIRDAALNQRDYVVSEAAAGCAGGTGTCRAVIPEVLPAGWTQWFVEANGSGLWSTHSSFCITDGGATPCNIIF